MKLFNSEVNNLINEKIEQTNFSFQSKQDGINDDIIEM